MPYPWWVNDRRRAEAVLTVRTMIDEARHGRLWSRTDEAVRRVGKLFEWAGKTVYAGQVAGDLKRADVLTKKKSIDLFDHAG